MQYLVDSNPMNERGCWEQRINPPALVRVENRFPGIAEAFIVSEPSMPPGIAVTGYLAGVGADTTAACGDVIKKQVAFVKMRTDKTLHTITIHDQVFPNCILDDFKVIERLEPSNDGVRQKVLFNWRPLSWGASA